jgi:hypothetical protein
MHVLGPGHDTRHLRPSVDVEGVLVADPRRFSHREEDFVLAVFKV